jgi:hypothetical protein
MQLNIFKKQFWKGQRLLLLTFLVVHVMVSFYYISHQNITFDEPDYIEYAKRWLKGKPERIQSLDDSKSPIVAICWIPRIVRQAINPNYQLNDYGRKDQREGRYMMIIFSLVTALYVYWWCKDFYGYKGWYLPLLLLLFEPLYLAYSTIITTDLACGAMLIALLYHFRKYIVLKSRRHFYLAAIFTTLAVVTKQNMLYILFLLPVLSLVYHLMQRPNKKLISKQSLLDLLLFIGIIILGINCFYYFHRSFISFGDYQFESNTLRNLQQAFNFLHAVPVPLPHAYVQSVDMIKAHSEAGAGTPLSTLNGVYMLGELKSQGGFWYYYIVLLWYKMPIGTMLLFIASSLLFIKKFNRNVFLNKYMFLVIPVVYYFLILSLFNQFQIGMRHILLIYPLLFVGLGYLFFQLKNAKPKYKLAVAACILYTFISVGVYYPFIIPYTNEFVTNKKMIYKKISDSSIDYGQSDSSVVRFVANNPGYNVATAIPTPGKYAVPMAIVLNTYLRDKNPYNWYRELEPKGLYRYVILLYDINEADLRKANLVR